MSLELISSLASLATVVISISSLAYWLGKKFGEIDSRFREVDRRFVEIDKRFQQIDERFREIDKRFVELEERLNRRIGEVEERLNRRIDEVEKKLGGRIDEMDARLGRVEKELSELRTRLDGIDSKLRRLGEAFTNYQEFLMRYLVHEGVLRREAAEVITTEARGVMRLATMNPLTKEEWMRIKELLDKSEKEDLTIEEAYELLNLARKVVHEYGEYPEAWKLHMYAAMMVGFAWKKQREKEEKEKKEEKK